MNADALLVDVPEAARLLGGIDTDTVYALCKVEGPNRLPNVRLGRRVLISLEGLREWIRANDGRDIFKLES